jgi:DNA-3-methyladenine glycosylase
VVARDLLGKLLALEEDGTRVARIVEVEAYLSGDPASHAFRPQTPRTAPMFGQPGHAYVYISYGQHHCMNVVAKSPGRPAGAVLIRGAEPVGGLPDDPRSLAGPGNLGRALRLRAARHTGLDLLRSPLTVRDAPRVPAALVGRSARIGLSGGATFHKAWRLYVRGSPGVSRSPRR